MKWAVNQSKLQRAVTKYGTNATEDAIRAEYIKMGGLVDERYINYEEEIKEAVLPENPSVSVTQETVIIPPPKEVKKKATKTK